MAAAPRKSDESQPRRDRQGGERDLAADAAIVPPAPVAPGMAGEGEPDGLAPAGARRPGGMGGEG